MNLDSFLQEREPEWERLERDLSRRLRRRPGAEEALSLGRGYRAAVADLALARRRYPGDPVVARLERLVLAGRQAIYADRERRRGAAWRFATRGYWRLVLERPPILLTSLLALWGPCVLAALWALHDPGAAIGLVPAKFRPAADPHVHRLAEGLATQAVDAGSIFTNNIEVSLLAFAGGLTLGVSTLVMLAFNGAMLGALAGITLQAGNFSVLVRYVAPHGLLELSCIAVAGAAGLRLALALIDPADQTRGASLRAAARPAMLLALGTAPWLVVAGLTEGFVTPRGLALVPAMAVGVTLAGTYWTLVVARGRGERRRAPGPAQAGASVRGVPLTAPPVTSP